MRILLQHQHRPDEISGVVTYCEEVRAALLPLGVEVDIVSSHGRSTWEIWKYVRDADLVHLNCTHLRFALAARLRGKPVVVKYHVPFWDGLVAGDFERLGFARRFQRDIAWNWTRTAGGGLRGVPFRLRFNVERFVRSSLRVLVAGLASERLTCSDFMARALELPFTVEVDQHPRAFPAVAPDENGAGAEPPRFVCAGRLHRTKGVDLLLDAAALLVARGHRFGVDVIGTGMEEGRLRAQASRLGLDGLVTFWGRLSRSSTLLSMARSVAVVVPSRWNDPAPYVIVEAASVGRSAIGARTGGIPELIGSAGLLFEPNDASALASRMEEVITHPEEARHHGVEAFRTLRASCDAEVVGRRLVALYSRLIAGAAGSVGAVRGRPHGARR